MMKTNLNVWLTDLTHTMGGEASSIGADTFPLGIGCIATYVESKIQFSSPVKLFRYPEKIDLSLKKEGAPHIIGFSSFVWNSELSLAIARRIKEIYPKTIVIMGGPNYPLTRKKQEIFLLAHPEIDFFILHEAEVPFLNLLVELDKNSFDISKIEGKLPSVHSINKNGKLVTGSGSSERIRDLDEIPSPYLSGKFDEFFDGRLWPLIQTKRGCPFKCTFCTEGEDYYTKISRYSNDRISAEIEYIGFKIKNSLNNDRSRRDLYIADSNFAMYKEDIETAKALQKTYELYGFPDHINTSTGKNKKERVLEVAAIMQGKMVLSGSVQSLDENVLNNIKRKNISVDGLMNLAQEADLTGANSFCELILGLPGETYASHLETIRKVINAGFNKIVPYQLMMLEATSLGSEDTIENYGMKTQFRVLPRAFGVYNILNKTLRIADIEEVCVQSNTLSYGDYINCRKMHLIITIFYNDVFFETTIKAIKFYGFSVFKWLNHILDTMKDSKLSLLFDDFESHTNNELWENKTDLEDVIKDPGIIESYAQGKSGFNLLYTFKAMSITQYTSSIKEAVDKSINQLIENEIDVVTNETMYDFLSHAVQWDINRATSILIDKDIEIFDRVSYDMLAFSSDDTPNDISKYKFQNSKLVEFCLTQEQKEYVDKNLKIFGSDSLGIGRFLSNSYGKKLLRNPVFV